MAEKKIIAVVGATGAQGGGMARAVFNDKSGEFAVRALTRKTDSDKAKELAQQGAEVVFADLDNVESLKKAFQGAYGAFCLTNFWEHFSAEKEAAQAKHMAEAAKAAGLKHVVWSTLEDTRKWVPLTDNRMPTLQNKYKVPHFDGKAEGDKFFEQQGVPTTYLMASFYWENFIFFGSGPQKDQNGNLAVTIPMDGAKLPGIAAEDIGKCALGVFKNPKEFIGKHIGIAGEALTIQEYADKFSHALGKKIGYNRIDPNTFRSFGFPGADEVGNMFEIYRDEEDYFITSRDVNLSRSLNPELQSFDTWLGQNKSRIPIPQ